MDSHSLQELFSTYSESTHYHHMADPIGSSYLDGQEAAAGDADHRMELEASRSGSSKFACPFFKRDPSRYQNSRSCTGPGWSSVRRTKEHLYRNHQAIYCPRCYRTFEDEKVRDSHLKKEPCARRSAAFKPEGLDPEQVKQLRRKKREKERPEAEKWLEMYRIAFPDDTDIPSPYYDYNPNMGATGVSSSGAPLHRSGPGTDALGRYGPRDFSIMIARRLGPELRMAPDVLAEKVQRAILDVELAAGDGRAASAALPMASTSAPFQQQTTMAGYSFTSPEMAYATPAASTGHWDHDTPMRDYQEYPAGLGGCYETWTSTDRP